MPLQLEKLAGLSVPGPACHSEELPWPSAFGTSQMEETDTPRSLPRRLPQTGSRLPNRDTCGGKLGSPPPAKPLVSTSSELQRRKLRPDGRCLYPTQPPLRPSPTVVLKFKLIPSSVSGLSPRREVYRETPDLEPLPRAEATAAPSAAASPPLLGSRQPPGKGSTEHCLESQAAACAPVCPAPKPTGAA